MVVGEGVETDKIFMDFSLFGVWAVLVSSPLSSEGTGMMGMSGQLSNIGYHLVMDRC